MAHTIMIQGTCSDAGKSLLVAALCRIYARKGYKVTPFKSQNMSLNSFVTPRGHEIGRAQAVQAQAAMRDPDVTMNPILLKPEGNSRSQIVVMGKPWKTLEASDYYLARKDLWVELTEVMDRLHEENDIIIVEGAGSPAEINLAAHEIVNMSIARYLDAPVLLTGDIDRGGVFASLYGTLELVEKDRELIKGFIINKFRGDLKLLQPGIDMLTSKCGNVPTVGVVPYLQNVYLAQEDSVFLQNKTCFGDPDGLELGVIRLPHLSNYDDLDPFLHEKGIKLHFISRPEDLTAVKAIIIPGTKTTVDDLVWMKQRGLFDAIREKASQGIPVAGICGGYQMMGRKLIDAHGIESNREVEEGLSLLNIQTEFNTEKETVQVKGALGQVPGFLNTLEGTTLEGYEIHMGHSVALNEDVRTLYHRTDGSEDGAVSMDGLFWGSYMHGIFDNLDLRRGFLASLGWLAPDLGEKEEDLRELELERIADAVEEALDMDYINQLMGL